jgi:hypothetical protein
MKLSVGIVGFGEIGSSLAKVYENAGIKCKVRDPFIGKNDLVNDCDIVNITIPFFGPEEFKKSIMELDLKKTSVVIIHSTMRLGTVNRLQELFPDNIVVCSPVRGVHPHLTEGLYTFEKFVGFSDKYLNDQKAKNKVLNHLSNIGLKPVAVKADEAELAKSMSTTYYGMCIAFTEDVGRMCDHYGLDFDTVYTRWQNGYNEGYEKLGKSNVRRPVLTRIPNESKIIGGHCVLPNAVIVKSLEPKESTVPMSEYILRYSDKESQVHRSKKNTLL